MSMHRMFARAGLTALVLGAGLLVPGPAAADQVIPDDLIVQGSECVGFDCVNNENFGFDTIKLKENNLRILFQDTSVAPFPTNDWRLIANDSASGGASYFAIEDSTAGHQVFRIEAAGNANSIYVDASGRVGFRTTTPVLDLHVNAINSPALRLQQNVGGGFGARTWDIVGNEANFFVRDVTGGSALPFRIRPGAPTSSIDIAANGNVGIGTAAPARKLDVVGAGQFVSNGNSPFVLIGDDANNRGSLSWTSASDVFAIATQVGGSNAGTLALQSGGGNVGIGTVTPAAQLHTTGAVRLAGVANCSSGIQSNASGDLSCLASSRQFKHVGGDLAPAVALANVMALRPQVGAYKATPDEPEHWLIAEDVAAIDPALVGRRNGEPYTVKIQGIVADLVAVIQQQQHNIEAQQRRIDALERAIAR